MRGFRKLERRTVIANLKTGRAVRGVLFDARGPLLEFRQAQVTNDAGTFVPADGSIFVDRAEVEFWQAVTLPPPPSPGG